MRSKGRVDWYSTGAYLNTSVREQHRVLTVRHLKKKKKKITISDRQYLAKSSEIHVYSELDRK